VPKFRHATPLTFKVIMAHLFHLKPIFDPSLKKVVRGAVAPIKSGLVRLGYFLARVKI